RTEVEGAAGEDAAVRIEHVAVLTLRVGGVDVERVGILHQELPPPHETEARPDLVPELDLDLVEVLREVAVGADLTSHQIGHDLLVGRAEAEIAVVAVLETKKLPPVLLP